MPLQEAGRPARSPHRDLVAPGASSPPAWRGRGGEGEEGGKGGGGFRV